MIRTDQPVALYRHAPGDAAPVLVWRGTFAEWAACERRTPRQLCALRRALAAAGPQRVHRGYSLRLSP